MVEGTEATFSIAETVGMERTGERAVRDEEGVKAWMDVKRRRDVRSFIMVSCFSLERNQSLGLEATGALKQKVLRGGK